MRPFNELNKVVIDIAWVLADLYFALDDFPVVGDVLQLPVFALWGYMNDLSIVLIALDDWDAGLFDSLWVWFRDRAPWLADPISTLWTGIWERISGAHTWMLDPVGGLWSGIWDAIRGRNAWLNDPASLVWDVLSTHFSSFIWNFLELHATIVMEVAGRILESPAIWNGPDYPEEEED